ncbi:MAG: hypothetical protein AAFZ15_13265 [Bacteroidota bacterium]
MMAKKYLTLFILFALVIWSCGEQPGQDQKDQDEENPKSIIINEVDTAYIGSADHVVIESANSAKIGSIGYIIINEVDTAKVILNPVGEDEDKEEENQ